MAMEFAISYIKFYDRKMKDLRMRISAKAEIKRDRLREAFWRFYLRIHQMEQEAKLNIEASVECNEFISLDGRESYLDDSLMIGFGDTKIGEEKGTGNGGKKGARV